MMESHGENNKMTTLHFSDGTLDINEIDDYASTQENNDSETSVDPKTLSWGPWTMHMTAKAGSKTLQACDYVGETLASFLGITTPKYQFEINEYHRKIKEDEEAQRQRDEEMGNWATEKITDHVTFQPPQSTNERPQVEKF